MLLKGAVIFGNGKNSSHVKITGFREIRYIIGNDKLVKQKYISRSNGPTFYFLINS